MCVAVCVVDRKWNRTAGQTQYGGAGGAAERRISHARDAADREAVQRRQSNCNIATSSKMALLRSYELDSEDSDDAESEDLDRLLRHRCMPVFRLPLPPWAS